MKLVNLSASVVVLASLLLAACGSKVASDISVTSSAGGVSNAKLATGTITGFGSVYVDGVELEDAQAATVSEQADGTFQSKILKLGQRVEVNHDASGRAERVQVNAAVIGKVSAIDTATLTLSVAQQLVTVNTDATKGPLTQFGSFDNSTYSSLADVKVNDYLEVYGMPVYDSVAKSYKVSATRIEKVSAITSVRVSGKMTNLNATNFTLSGLTVNYDAKSVIVPSASVLANDQNVTVWSTAASVAQNAITAQRIRVFKANQSNSSNTDVAIQLGGVVSNNSTADKTFELSGTKVNASAASISPAGAVIADNSYVQVKGTVGSDGVLSAKTIKVNSANTVNDFAKVRLSGVISSLVDQTSFVVRGVPVDASSTTLVKNCAQDLTTNTYVEVQAQVQAGTDVVLATNLSCRPAQSAPPLAIREAVGMVSKVDTTALTFVLTPSFPLDASALNVRWSAATNFVGVTAATLADATTKEIVVLGNRDSDGKTIVAHVVIGKTHAPGQDYAPENDRPNPGSGGSNAGGSDQGAGAVNTKWTRYRKDHSRH